MKTVKIKRIQTHYLQYKSERSYTSARNFWHNKRNFLLLEIEADNGMTGWGEALGFPLILKSMIEDYLRPLLIGEDVFQPEVIWNKMAKYLRDTEYGGLGFAAISAIDIALWDLIGRILAVPCYALLGGAACNEIKVYGTGLFFKSRDFKEILDDSIEEAESYVNAGFKHIKMKIGLGLEKDLERIDLLRKHFNNSILLMVDANNCYDYNTALELGKELEKRDIGFFEAPIPVTDIAGHVDLCKNLDIRVADGETLSTLQDYDRFLRNHAVDIIQPDLCYCGGFTAGMRIKVLSNIYSIPIMPHIWGSAVAMTAAAHFISTLPPFNTSFLDYLSPMLEFEQSNNPLQTELLMEPFIVRDGLYRLGNEPGLGITINRDILQKYAV